MNYRALIDHEGVMKMKALNGNHVNSVCQYSLNVDAKTVICLVVPIIDQQHQNTQWMIDCQVAIIKQTRWLCGPYTKDKCACLFKASLQILWQPKIHDTSSDASFHRDICMQILSRGFGPGHKTTLFQSSGQRSDPENAKHTCACLQWLHEKWPLIKTIMVTVEVLGREQMIIGSLSYRNWYWVYHIEFFWLLLYRPILRASLQIQQLLTSPITQQIMRLWFARDIWRYRNVFWLIDWLIKGHSRPSPAARKRAIWSTIRERVEGTGGRL